MHLDYTQRINEIKMNSELQIRRALDKKGRIKSLREIQDDNLLVVRCAGCMGDSVKNPWLREDDTT